MSTGLLEQRDNYPNSGYEYGYGKDGTADEDGDGRKEIDCSHLLNRMLRDAGYNIPYRSTSQLATDATHFDVILLNSVQPGDIALWTGLHHTGVIEDMDVTRTKGNFFGSQTSTGPKSAKYGAGSGYWPMPNKYLRPKAEYKSGAQPAPAPTPATTPAPAGAPVMNFQYPIRKHGGSQFEDAEELYKALEVETSGDYLLGSHQFWHGGIHITNASAPQCVRDEPVRCIGDGVVVAYRLNKNYQSSEYIGATSCANLRYSTSFCLVRHKYESPTNEKSNAEKTNRLSFFSLYMHILPYELYSSEEESNRVVKVVNGGWPARTQHKDLDESKVVGDIPTGVEFEILKEQPTLDGKYTFAQGRILKGKISDLKKDDIVWFATQEDGAPIKNSKGNERLKVVLPPERSTPGYWKGMVDASVTALQGLKVRSAPVGENGGAQVAPEQVLCTGSMIQFDSGEVQWLVLEDGKKYPMAECTFLPSEGTGLKGTGVLPEKFWCCVDDVGPKRLITRKKITPTAFDSVVITNTAIKAGEPIGYMGLYETPANATGGVRSKHQVHVEVFSADAELEKYLKNPAELVDGNKYIILSPGQMLAAKTGTDEAPVFTEQGPAMEVKTFASMDRATVLTDAAGKEWIRVTVQNDGKPQTGFVSKEKGEVICQHDWEKLGFRVVKETNTSADGFLDPENMPAFFQELYKKIDEKGTKDNEVTPDELHAALRDPEIRSSWSKLIAYHPTEWQAKSSEPKWAKLKRLLDDSPELLKHEQDRIDKLVFWDEMAGSMQVALTNQVYHFHPIEFISNLKPKGGTAHAGLFTVADGKAAIKVIYEKYGKEMAIIIERMYRDETAHFESGQYANCGTGGMEAFGGPPYYGWDGAIFEAHPEYTPVGTWSAFENKGMSGQGGNQQVTDKKKVFVVLPSVLAGMEYKAAYINKYDGNWARWHSKETSVQNVYKTHIQAIRARFVEALEKGE
ncbi:hypothetical protein BLL42_14495 [Pseudomonas frederiksbergensis]|uniref:NlpC/P60 domain-containing protein n=1 Tax=Pseudomonas frederiksbergensis TaxID=104087 RepID=A0A1J0EL78_9PSED|nr:hypothetical protein [Pseudomonas frederiksbergensis]APC16882.1 hypothetical protein BLL42_14495 [Pseudomonas frederiksbergensis]